MDSTGHDEPRLCAHDLAGGDIAYLQTRGAETVHVHARGALVVAGDEGRDAGDVTALLADGHDTAEDHIVHQRRV